MGKKIKITSKETGKVRYVDEENLAFFTKENFAKEGLYGKEEQYKYFCDHPEEIEDQKLFSELEEEFGAIMIILRLKIFARRTPLDKTIRDEFEPSGLTKEAPIFLKIERSSTFEIQYETLTNTDRDIINNYIKNFKLFPKE